jgi:hypothetical protein
MRCVGVARSGNFELDNIFSRLGDSYRDTLESICFSNLRGGRRCRRRNQDDSVTSLWRPKSVPHKRRRNCERRDTNLNIKVSINTPLLCTNYQIDL